MRKALRDEIAGAISDLPALNHHEHAWQSFSAERFEEYDLPRFLCGGYVGGDLEASSLHLEAQAFDYLKDPSLPDGAEEIWKRVRPFLDSVRTTSYFRYLLICLKDLFDISEEDIFSERWRDASERMRRHSRENAGNGAALCERMGVRATILDAFLGKPAELPQLDSCGHRILHIARMDMFIHEDRGLVETLESCQARNFDEWLAIFDHEFQHSIDAGAVGFKSGLAYNRRIEYSDPLESEAARIFATGLLAVSPAEKAVYQDYMMNRLCRLCVQADVPLQIHTGLHAGIGNTLENSRPTLLTSLFQRHGDLRVDLFHGGYPWYEEAGLMAKYFPNVHVNGCWLHQVSPSAYRAALRTWIEIVPLNKIFAWGGDHNFLEHSYASLLLTRRLVAEVLSDLVAEEYFDLETALRVARRIFHDNGAEFWRIA